jgi:hypothetical protein
MKNKDKLNSMALASSTLILYLRLPRSEKLKMQILLIAAFLVLLSISSPVSAAIPVSR